MASGSFGPGPGGMTLGWSSSHGFVRLLPLLLLVVQFAGADMNFDPGRDDGDEEVALRWWVPALEWGGGVAVGTGVGVLLDAVGPVSIPWTSTPADWFIVLLNSAVVPVALNPQFGCAAGCDAVGLATRKEGSIWYGTMVGAIVVTMSQPLGNWVHDRTNNAVLARLVPAAIGSLGAVAGYNVERLVGDIPADVNEQTLGTGVMWERQSLFRQTVLIEAPCGAAMAAVGGALLADGLHTPPDAAGRLAAPARTFNRVVDIAIIYPLATMVGIDVAATAMGRRNGFWLGYLGATVGTGAVWGIGALTGFDEQLDTRPLARLIPAVAAGAVAAIGYNIVDAEDGVMADRRLTGPVLASLAPEWGASGGIDFDLRLATLRF